MWKNSILRKVKIGKCQAVKNQNLKKSNCEEIKMCVNQNVLRLNY